MSLKDQVWPNGVTCLSIMRPNGDKVLTNCMAKVWPDGMNNPSPIRPNGDKSWPIVRVRPQSMTRRYDRYARGASASHKGPLQGARNGRTLAPSTKPAPLATRCNVRIKQIMMQNTNQKSEYIYNERWCEFQMSSKSRSPILGLEHQLNCDAIKAPG